MPINLAGVPAMSIPGGKINGLPVGLQIISRAYEEELIFELANVFQRNIGFNL